MSFLKNIEEIRARARQKLEEGPVTADYQLDRGQAIGILEALATEIVCVLRYQFHYFMATGIQFHRGRRGVSPTRHRRAGARP
jgi:bacterioferritin